MIGEIGTAGGTGYAIEFGGDAIRALSMEGRMTVCNMAIEAGARAGMVAVDETTIENVKNRPYSPQGVMLDRAVEAMRELANESTRSALTRHEKRSNDRQVLTTLAIGIMALLAGASLLTLSGGQMSSSFVGGMVCRR